MTKPGRKPRVTDDELLDTLAELTNDYKNPVATTDEVAEALPLKYRSVYDRLTSLHDDGHIHKKKVGAKGAVWWPSIDEMFKRRGEDDENIPWLD